MGDYDDTAKNPMLNDFASLAVRVALHTADPGGANQALNEVTGGGYARQTVSWAAAAAGVAAMSNSPVFSVPAVTVTHASFWNSAGTVRYGKVALDDPAIFGTAGTLTLTAGTIDLAL